MQLKLFVVPIKNVSEAEAGMNGFLRGHRVLAVKKWGLNLEHGSSRMGPQTISSPAADHSPTLASPPFQEHGPPGSLRRAVAPRLQARVKP
jgi:hypothetical protein